MDFLGEKSHCFDGSVSVALAGARRKELLFCIPLTIHMKNHPQITLPRRFTLEAEFHDNTPFVWGLLNGERRLFLFDSGAQDMALNSRYLDEMAVTPGGGAQGVTGMVSSVYTLVDEIAFGEWKMTSFELMASDLSHVEEEWGVKVHGIIGFRHLIHYDWMVDYRGGTITFMERLIKSEFNIAGKAKTNYTFHLPAVDIEIGSNSFRFLVDTGASVVVFDQAKKYRVMDEVSGLYARKMASASPDEADIERGTLSNFKVGELEFGSHTIDFMDLEAMKARFGDFDGIIGYPLLSKYRTIVSWSFRGLLFLAD